MGLDELFKMERTEPPLLMDKTKFFEKTKELLSKISNSYARAWTHRRLGDDQMPDESVCSKCTGFGKFIYNGEEKQCAQDKFEGECYHVYIDYEEICNEIEGLIQDIEDLLYVDGIECKCKK